ncbi:hypothetical protein LXT21_22470 [Myxococcus sp. K38C18041901]|uniref:CARDB domain-containing protein n=1 Tax=Myxococcus guangdongensis TaxID=2906760 RepID=UPI0020A7A532|nr:CARDB domain-containing protein [Myxococcus guangdongensis]MCP3061555.1 hypothetical protein [Myxococcus guangdongensis]
MADFVVTSVKGPASLQLGAALQAVVTVCNQGDASSGGSVPVELYLSADTVITPDRPLVPASDVRLGAYSMVQVPAPAPGQCATVRPFVTLDGPVNVQGAYYLAAWANPRHGPPPVPERNLDNNVRVGPRVGVGNQPDFVVTSVTAPTSALKNQPFLASAKVCNLGTGSGSVSARFYLSADATIVSHVPLTPASDTFLSEVTVGHLQPGQCQRVSHPVSASPVLEGPYTVGVMAVASNLAPELDLENNSRASAPIGIGFRPDLVVTSVAGPGSLAFGQALTAQARVCNQGTQAGRAPVTLLLSADERLAGTFFGFELPDFVLGSQDSGMLEPGACRDLPFQANAPSVTPGAYYLGAWVDLDNGVQELSEANNTRLSARLGVGHGPDLVVTEVSGPSSLAFGQSLAAQVRVCNQGTAASVPTTMELRLALDTNYHGEESSLGSASVPALSEGACQVLSLTATPDLFGHPVEGSGVLVARVDGANTVAELVEDNNSTSGARIDIGSRSDLVVTALSGASSVRVNEPFDVQVTVCNQGTLGTQAIVHLYASDDEVITPGTGGQPGQDLHVATKYLDVGLDAGACHTTTVNATALGIPAGTYFLGAHVELRSPGIAEFSDENNTKAAGRLGVGDKADFVVTSLTGPASVSTNQPFNLAYEVCNQGTVSASQAQLHFVLSPNDAIIGQPDDRFLGMTEAPALQPGQCTTGTFTVPPGHAPIGRYHPGAVLRAPPSVVEFFTDNNLRVGAALTVTY